MAMIDNVMEVAVAFLSVMVVPYGMGFATGYLFRVFGTFADID